MEEKELDNLVFYIKTELEELMETFFQKLESVLGDKRRRLRQVKYPIEQNFDDFPEDISTEKLMEEIEYDVGFLLNIGQETVSEPAMDSYELNVIRTFCFIEKVNGEIIKIPIEIVKLIN